MPVLLAGLSLTDALTVLSDDCAATVAPTLDEGELRRLLRVAAVADDEGNQPDAFFDWTAGKTYRIGDRVVPLTRNGFVFQATASGAADPTDEPAWPDEIDDTTTDGDVTWTCEDLAPWTPTYSRRGLHMAAAAGWDLKGGKLSNRPTLSAEGVSLHPEEQRKYFQERAAYHRKKGGGGSGTLLMSGFDDWTARSAVVIAS